MMYLLDLSGHDDNGALQVDRFGGRFRTIEDAEEHGRLAARTGRFAFEPATLWIRDEENQVVRRVAMSTGSR